MAPTRQNDDVELKLNKGDEEIVSYTRNYISAEDMKRDTMGR
jgi:hypothetical protein